MVLPFLQYKMIFYLKALKLYIIRELSSHKSNHSIINKLLVKEKKLTLEILVKMKHIIWFMKANELLNNINYHRPFVGHSID